MYEIVENNLTASVFLTDDQQQSEEQPKKSFWGRLKKGKKSKRYDNASLEVYYKMILTILLHIYSLLRLGYNLLFNKMIKKKTIVQLFPLLLRHKPAIENPKIRERFE